MNDLEITRLCAEATGRDGFIPCTSGPFAHPATLTKLDGNYAMFYSPLQNDAQALELVKKFCLDIQNHGEWWVSKSQKNSTLCKNADLNRAICECVARMQASKP